MSGNTIRRAYLVGVAGLLLCGLGGLGSPQQFFRSYLLGYVFWFGVALGCLPLLMLQHMTGGAWGLVIRRLLESGARTLPWLAVFFLPIALALHELYPWAHTEEVARDEILRHRVVYLNAPFFLGRAAFYFLVWTAIGWLLCRWSEEQDRTAEAGLARRMQVFSGPGLALYGLTVTFASVDWVMSLDSRWASTLFGAWFVAGQGLTAFSFVLVLLVLLADRPPLAEVLRPGVFHDLGNLLLAFLMVWAYLSFSQFLIVYSGNLPEEIPYYLDRSQGGWEWVAAALVVFHFAVPFVLLLFRNWKRQARRLGAISAGVLLMRFVDVLWLVTPNFSRAELRLHWMDLAAPVGLGGIWLGMFLQTLRARPLLPLHDPYQHEAFGDGQH